MVTAAFHLNNREVKRALSIYNNGKPLLFRPILTYLGLKLDRLFTFRHHLETLRKKLSTRITLLRRFAGSGWGANAKTPRRAAPCLVYSTAEHCAPAWSHSTYLVYIVLNNALHIVTECLRLTSTDFLSILSGIQTSKLRCLGATLSLANRSTMNHDKILRSQQVGSRNIGQERLRS